MSGKAVVILQSNYIPWKGYFDLINIADEFIFHDDLQFTSGDWRNRNKIKTASGTRWLSIPVGRNIGRLICDVEFSDLSWKKKHKRVLEEAYRTAKYFSKYKYVLENLYENDFTNLSSYNQSTIRFLADVLGIKTFFSDSRDYQVEGKKTERLIQLLKKSNASTYITGPSAKSYIDEEMFNKENIKLVYFDYSGYPEYPQLFGNFIHEVSILDLIFNVGPDCKEYMKSFTVSK